MALSSPTIEQPQRRSRITMMEVAPDALERLEETSPEPAVPDRKYVRGREDLRAGWIRLTRQVLPVFLLMIGGTAILAAGFGLLATSGHFAVKRIALAGVPPERLPDIVEAIETARGEPLILLRLERLAEKLQMDPWIRAARLRKVFPDTLRAEFEFRQPCAVVHDFLVAADGVILAEAGENISVFPRIPGTFPGEDLYPGATIEDQTILAALHELSIPTRIDALTETTESGRQYALSTLSWNQPGGNASEQQPRIDLSTE